MKIVIFGLTVSSSWGNGHATIWRGLCGALSATGHEITFYEKNAPYYAAHRDLAKGPGFKLSIYNEWRDIEREAARDADEADVCVVTSYCTDALRAASLAASSTARIKAFYDLDAPVTLKSIKSGIAVPYIGERGLADFEIVLSYTGGRALSELKTVLGANRVVPLYGAVDPAAHGLVAPLDAYGADLSYLGTYAEDRQDALLKYFVEPSKILPRKKFIIGGSLYPEAFPWTENIFYARHVPPSAHPSFYCSSPFTLNVTRGAMSEMGYCPSGRLFEAAACGRAILSDWWEGLDVFFEPGREIVIVRSTNDVIEALGMEEEKRAAIGAAARKRALAEHTADARAREFEEIMNGLFESF